MEFVMAPETVPKWGRALVHGLEAVKCSESALAATWKGQKWELRSQQKTEISH